MNCDKKQKYLVYRANQKFENVLPRIIDRKKVVTCIEDLPNEIFYSIFDYLDGFHLYQSFANLNSRCQTLLLDQRISLNIIIDSKSEIIAEHSSKVIINQNRSRIISIQLLNALASQRFLKLITIDSSFNRLQSLSVVDIGEQKLLLLLKQLVCLPRFYSLNFVLIGNLESFATIYQSIFRLPVLNHMSLTYGPWSIPFTLPIARTISYSRMQYLNIDTMMNLCELITVLSHTPHLRHLSCRQLSTSNLKVKIKDSVVLPYLTHMNLDRCHISFFEFKVFIQKIGSHLESLRLTTLDNELFLDPQRWQNLILQYLPHLQKYKFEYEQSVSGSFQSASYHRVIHQFTTQFWMDRKCFLHIYADAAQFNHHRIVYSVHSEKTKLNDSYEYAIDRTYNEENITSDIHSQTTENRVVSLFQSVELIATNRCDFEQYQVFLQNINVIFQTLRITSLNIDLHHTSVELLADFILQLPNLDALSMTCLPLLALNISSSVQSKLQLIAAKNKITKLNLEKWEEENQIQFIVKLFPHLEFLQVGCHPSMNIELLIYFILLNYMNTSLAYLHCFCLHIATADEKMIKTIKDMIDYEKLLICYSMRRNLDKIYLQWK